MIHPTPEIAVEYFPGTVDVVPYLLTDEEAARFLRLDAETHQPHQ